MSKVHEETIICPNCKGKGKFDLWESMNVDLDPELRDKVFSDEAFIYTCPECGHHTGVPYGTLYHDMKHRFMLFFDFFKPDDFNYEHVEIPDMPGTVDYTYRHVTGLWRLKEKILILEKGLNDVAIERMKYMIKHVLHPEMAEKDVELYFGVWTMRTKNCPAMARFPSSTMMRKMTPSLPDTHWTDILSSARLVNWIHA